MGLIAAGSIIVLSTAACGDDRPSHEAWTERVTEICQAAGERHEQASSGFDFEAFDPATSDLAEIVPLIEENVAIGREAVNELDELRGPKSDEDKVNRLVELTGRNADNADEMIAAARTGDRDEFMARVAAEEELHAEFPDDVMFEGC